MNVDVAAIIENSQEAENFTAVLEEVNKEDMVDTPMPDSNLKAAEQVPHTSDFEDAIAVEEPIPEETIELELENKEEQQKTLAEIGAKPASAKQPPVVDQKF